MVSLIVPGTPCPNARARKGKGSRPFTPERTRQAREAVRLAWMHHGKPRIDGDRVPLALTVECVFARPADHFLADGSLSAKGRREPYPHGHGDWDNLGKLVTDALQDQDGMRLAFADDAQVTDALVVKRWASEGELAHTRIHLLGTLPETVGSPVLKEAA